MATDIDNTAEFNFNNMKPAADEEITALWGKNIADNTGALYYIGREAFNVQLVFGHSPTSGMNGTSHYRKYPGNTTLHGTLHLSSYKPAGVATGTAGILIDGTAVVEKDFGNGNFDNQRMSFTHDASNYTDFSDYDVVWYITPDFGGETQVFTLGCAAHGTQT